MRLHKLCASGAPGQILRRAILSGMIASTFVLGSVQVTADEPGFEPIQNSMWKSRIRRLKLTDPESSEEMLARAKATQPVSLSSVA